MGKGASSKPRSAAQKMEAQMNYTYNSKNEQQSSWIAVMALFIAAVITLAGCSGEKQAYEEAKAADSVVMWRRFLEDYPNSAHADKVRERIKLLSFVDSAKQILQGDDAVAKTKTLLQLQKTPEEDIPLDLVPALIAVLPDDTSVQIPENLVGAEVKLNSQFAAGSVLRMQEGDMFPTDSGVVIAGENAVLRISTPGTEAKRVLTKLAGKDLGADTEKWKAWWESVSKEEGIR